MTVSYRYSRALVHDVPPQAPEPEAPSSAAGLAAEWRTVLLPARLLARGPQLARVPRGDGGPVIDIPGWKAPEASMAPLRAYLRAAGHDARGWGLGVNTGNPERDSEILAERVLARQEQTGRRVALVGWSLGGTIARETARTVPHAVSRVITYGTPAIGGPTYTLGARAYGPSEAARIRQLITDLDRERPIRVPITAIFTRRDRVVSWPACIDRTSPDVEHVEVRSTHAGMGLDPEVWQIVATRLARQH
jgi:pimeloyl-ACP methyl ester carboxylesterase